MIKVENDYEPVIYEQPFHSQMYENQSEFLLDYYTRPKRNNIPTEPKINKANTLIKPEKEQVPCSSTNHNYQNVLKRPPSKKNLDNSISLRKSKKQRISTTRP